MTMASRLDKLYELLESNNSSIRLTAALQIGQLTSNSNVQLNTLLNKLLPYIKHKQWAVRIAASEAVKNIGINAKTWIPYSPSFLKDETNITSGLILLDKLNLSEILKIGSRLYSSDIKDIDDENATQANFDRNELNRHLGVLWNDDTVMNNLIDSEDCKLFKSDVTDHKLSVSQEIENIFAMENCEKKTLNPNYSALYNEPSAKRIRLEKLEEGVDQTKNWWPWADFCDNLIESLWNPKWEIRHGSATALREIARTQGSVMIGKYLVHYSRNEFNRLHIQYLEDVVRRLLCTLALDQLSDFIADEMVAPVRESCAQAIGVISTYLPENVVEITCRHLLDLLSNTEWTVTHGALLGLKYVLASRMDLSETLLPMVYNPIRSHLKDNRDDDVMCAAASALMPIFSNVNVNINKHVNLEALRADLWTVLTLKSDCTSPGATNSILHLLEKLYLISKSNIDKKFDVDDIGCCLNRLHLYYYNYGESIRLSAINTCSALLNYLQDFFDIFPHKTVFQVMSQLYQRMLLDDSSEVIKAAEDLWNWFISGINCQLLAQSCIERIDIWMCGAMQPARLSYSQELLQMPDIEVDNKYQLPDDFYIGGRESYLSEGDSNTREESVLTSRITACKALALLCQKLSEIAPLAEHILGTIIAQTHLRERLAMQRFVAACILAYWSPPNESCITVLPSVRQQLLISLSEPIYYQELLPMFRQMVKACRDLIKVYTDRHVPIPAQLVSSFVNPNLPQCQSLVTNELNTLLNSIDPSADTVFSCARTAVDICSQHHQSLLRMVEVTLGRALLTWRWLPDKLTPLIRPLMDVVRYDSRLPLQQEAAAALSELLIINKSISPLSSSASLSVSIGKLLRNVISSFSDSIDSLGVITGSDTVIVLQKVEQFGREVFPGHETVPDESNFDSPSAIKFRGCRLVLEKVCRRIVSLDCTSSSNDECLSIFFDAVYHAPLRVLSGIDTNTADLLGGLQVMESCIPYLKAVFKCYQLDIGAFATETFERGLSHRSNVIRHWSARVLSCLLIPSSPSNDVSVSRNLVDSILLERALPALDRCTNELLCLGVIELLYLSFHQQGMLGYRLALVIPVLPSVLRALNAPIDYVRRTATLVFSQLLNLMPLEQSCADTDILTDGRIAYRRDNRHFIEGLMRPDSLAPCSVESYIGTPLRYYQQQGVNWLAFLARYGLHGILADDMGLGKTLQAICIIVSQHQKEHALSPPSLIVCPTTLTAHWQSEFKKHVSVPGFNCLMYGGSADHRQGLLQSSNGRYNVVITSYEILRNDIDQLFRPPDSDAISGGAWNYIVLDEGHLIRNHRSKLAMAAKSVVARHRLVLTGTPIQNRVAELWSLFDFLMPGLLGTHSEFHRKYGRYLGQHSSSTGRRVDSEQGTVALDSLHKQVLPFLLRRIKEDVLDELPPKILQDYVCTMTPLQARLYGYLVQSTAGSDVSHLIDDDQTTVSPQMTSDQRKHVFQALHYLRLVCNHPSLALCNSHPLLSTVVEELADSHQSIDDIELSGKLVALKQLIIDCGIGGDDCGASTIGSDTVVSSHRLLIFCQSRAMIGLVERLLRTHIPKASFLKLDGSILARDRHLIVDKFNDDPSVDILLLTTSIGGLGLNLCSADTVIFIEHDWNPMRDLQAMDRAHRIGQKRTVNVYRLITADSIEEKIMNLQQFKMHIANTVVSSDNKQVGSMVPKDSSILDSMNKEVTTSGTTNKHGKVSQTGLKSVLSNLEHIYDSVEDYEKEYNLESFVEQLSG